MNIQITFYEYKKNQINNKKNILKFKKNILKKPLFSISLCLTKLDVNVGYN